MIIKKLYKGDACKEMLLIQFAALTDGGTV